MKDKLTALVGWFFVLVIVGNMVSCLGGGLNDKEEKFCQSAAYSGRKLYSINRFIKLRNGGFELTDKSKQSFINASFPSAGNPVREKEILKDIADRIESKARTDSKNDIRGAQLKGYNICRKMM